MRKLTWILLSALWAASAGVDAQTYPSRPIRIIVPSTPGAAVDFTARLIGQRLTDAWGQQIVIDNRSGAGGIIAHELAAKAVTRWLHADFFDFGGPGHQPAALEGAIRFLP